MVPSFALTILVALLAHQPLHLSVERGPRIVDLGILHGTYGVYPQAISADGLTIVGSLDGPGFPKAFRWTEATGLVGLTKPKILDSSQVWDVSGQGELAIGNYKGRAVAWNPSGVMVSLGTLGQGKSASSYGAYTISDDGTRIFGKAFVDGQPRVFVWESGNGMKALPIGPQWIEIYPQSCSNQGTIMVGVGTLRTNDVNYGLLRAFRWTEDTGFKDLGAFQAGWMSIAFGISQDGTTIVGWSGTGNGAGDLACRWTASGLENLGALAGDVWSECFAVNADGSVIVGVSRSSSLEHHAVMWTPDHGIIDLQKYLPTIGVPLGSWQLMYATAVSADGRRIAGWGLHGNQSRGWLVELGE